MKITARSSHGSIVYGSETGLVIDGESKLCGCTDCPQIDRFDLIEYKKFYGVTEMPDELDILDIGYWAKDGIYEEPCHGWREEVAILRAGGDLDEPVKIELKKTPNIIRILPIKEDYTSVTITIPNVNLHLFEKQRYAFREYTAGIDSFQDERDGLENFLNAIGDAFYDQTYGRCDLLPELEDAMDVKRWFEHLIDGLQISIHPDDPFEEYVNFETGEPCFDPETSALLNEKMRQAFDICGDDIYGIGIEIIRKGLHMPEEEAIS